jgi:hypothetical protein
MSLKEVIKRLIRMHESKFQGTAPISGKLYIKILKLMKCLHLTENPKNLENSNKS